MLEADVEVDRRDFTVSVAPRVAGAGWEAGLAAGPEVVWCRLAEAPGSEATVTVLDRPCCGADGMFRPWSAQVRT